jgi:hypothetical protein
MLANTSFLLDTLRSFHSFLASVLFRFIHCGHVHIPGFVDYALHSLSGKIL